MENLSNAHLFNLARNGFAGKDSKNKDLFFLKILLGEEPDNITLDYVREHLAREGLNFQQALNTAREDFAGLLSTVYDRETGWIPGVPQCVKDAFEQQSGPVHHDMMLEALCCDSAEEREEYEYSLSYWGQVLQYIEHGSTEFLDQALEEFPPNTFWGLCQMAALLEYREIAGMVTAGIESLLESIEEEDEEEEEEEEDEEEEP